MLATDTPNGSTLLVEFLNKHHLSLRATAHALGVSSPTIIAWRRGWSRPRAHLRTAIEAWTRGAVPADSWLTPAERSAGSVTPYTPEPNPGQGGVNSDAVGGAP